MTRPESPPRRVLIVDDDVAMAEMLVDCLADLGYVAVAVASAERAVVHAGEEPFDALVTDIRMPGMDGLDLAARVRRFAPDLPLVLMTAYGAIGAAMEASRLGAAHLLVKPFKVDHLVHILERLIAARRVPEGRRSGGGGG